MSKPVVAVVGRPNVGKSTLFNRLVGRRVSIVEDTPGVTRDRIYADTEWRGIPFVLIDTGGIDSSSDEIIPSQMRAQADIAIETADVIVFIVDGKAGLTSADLEVGEMLQKRSKNVILVVNKADTAKLPDSYYDFYELGLGDPLPVSAANMLGLGDLLDRITESFPEKNEEDEDTDDIKIAVIGRPNTGKSSLVNAVTGEERVIVSDIAGTTRDSIDLPFEYDDQKYTLIDTAGIRRKKNISENIEKYSVIRSISAIERSDVCVLMIDATEGVTEQDKKIGGMAHEAGKGVIIAVNKWDLVTKDSHTMGKFERKVRAELSYMPYAPILFISAVKGQRLLNVLVMARAVAEHRALRVPTGQLNAVMEDAMMMRQPPSDKGKQLKIYYVTQVGVKPPLFSFQVNKRSLMHFSYSRYLENKLREAFDFSGTSVKFVFREKGEKNID
ncbi:MAG: ribosome biogenesis GTPase Der [Anaerovoracaceae bacterium]|nr:ribosome biogenesis GTPase Der [Bacillota bacterium]MDY2670269.1 ribosome biogenesis GTPase Der [Anaerovoracaceae bacterium]